MSIPLRLLVLQRQSLRRRIVRARTVGSRVRSRLEAVETEATSSPRSGPLTDLCWPTVPCQGTTALLPCDRMRERGLDIPFINRFAGHAQRAGGVALRRARGLPAQNQLSRLGRPCAGRWEVRRCSARTAPPKGPARERRALPPLVDESPFAIAVLQDGNICLSTRGLSLLAHSALMSSLANRKARCRRLMVDSTATGLDRCWKTMPADQRSFQIEVASCAWTAAESPG